MTDSEVDFLTLADVVEIHNNQIELYGGQAGIMDIALLSSALAVPMSTFNGLFLHSDVFEMAAAYIYHVCQNHPFIDGNKRTALVTGLVFLDFNNIRIDASEDELFSMMIKVASGEGDKAFIANVLRERAFYL